jgi:hypothetical protein
VGVSAPGLSDGSEALGSIAPRERTVSRGKSSLGR